MSSADQRAVPSEYSGKWRAECFNTRPTLLHMEYNVKLKKTNHAEKKTQIKQHFPTKNCLQDFNCIVSGVRYCAIANSQYNELITATASPCTGEAVRGEEKRRANSEIFTVHCQPSLTQEVICFDFRANGTTLGPMTI